VVDRGSAVPEFDASFPALYRRAYRAAFRLTGDRELSEDLAQEALTRAYSRWASLDDRREGWVVTTTARLAVGHWRKASRRGTATARSSSVSDEAHVADRIDLTRLLDALPRRQRQVAVLRYLDDRSEVEVAALLGCSVGSVKKHASRAAAALRAAMTIDPAADIEGA
jgi:RNA polymerase sigma factor (sigma-70 family)